MRVRRKAPASLDDIADKIDSLIRHAESIAHAATVLHGRIQPFDDEKVPDRPVFPRRLSQPASIETIYEMLRDFDGYLRALAIDTSAIRSKLDMIVGDAVSVQDMKPYVQSHPRRRS